MRGSNCEQIPGFYCTVDTDTDGWYMCTEIISKLIMLNRWQLYNTIVYLEILCVV